MIQRFTPQRGRQTETPSAHVTTRAGVTGSPQTTHKFKLVSGKDKLEGLEEIIEVRLLLVSRNPRRPEAQCFHNSYALYYSAV